MMPHLDSHSTAAAPLDSVRAESAASGPPDRLAGRTIGSIPWTGLARFGFSLVIVVGVVLGGSVWRYGSILGLPQVFAGQVLGAERMKLSCDSAEAGDDRVATFRLRNVASRPVRVVGMKSSCGCGTTRDFPLTINSGETQSLPVTIHVSDRTPIGEFRVSNELMLDTESAPVTLEASLVVRPRQR